MGDKFVPFWLAYEFLEVVEEVESLALINTVLCEETMGGVPSHRGYC